MPHLDAQTLQARLSALPAPPRDRGVVRLLVLHLSVLDGGAVRVGDEVVVESRP